MLYQLSYGTFAFASAKVGLIFDMAKYSADNFEIRLLGGSWEGRGFRGEIGCASLVEEGAYLFHDGEEFRLCLGA